MLVTKEIICDFKQIWINYKSSTVSRVPILGQIKTLWGGGEELTDLNTIKIYINLEVILKLQFWKRKLFMALKILFLF